MDSGLKIAGMTWNMDIAKAFDISVGQLPEIIPSSESTGRVIGSLAVTLGFKKTPAVVIGGNDAVLAAYSLGIANPGDIINVNGTCEITLVCVPRCIPSTKYNIRAHVLPDRWLTLHVMNAGGKALEWFHDVFCSEMEVGEFYDRFLPRAIDNWLARDSGVTYVPYLMGSRYSLEPLKAEFRGLTPETSRDEILTAMIRALCEYQKEHLQEIGAAVPLQNVVHVTGGAVNPAIIRAKQRWMKNCKYIHDEQSSMKGAAMLGGEYLQQNHSQY